MTSVDVANLVLILTSLIVLCITGSILFKVYLNNKFYDDQEDFK